MPSMKKNLICFMKIETNYPKRSLKIALNAIFKDLCRFPVILKTKIFIFTFFFFFV